MLKYRCLVLDHDDTVVNSTAVIHYPAFLDALRQLRPGRTVTLEEYFLLNYDPGFLPWCERELGFTAEEFDREFEIWQGWVRTHVPKVYPGVGRIIRRQKEEGGLVCVVSHSMRDGILRDYRENGLPEPDIVFGWEQPRERRKPHPWPLEEIMRTFRLQPQELLMVDDLRPGRDMAETAGVDFAAAMWSHEIPVIRASMRADCRLYFEQPETLESFLFGGGA